MNFKDMYDNVIDDFSKIVIYGNGLIKYNLERKNPDAYRLDGEKISTIYSGAPVTILLSCEVKTARKENLNRTDCYLLKYREMIGYRSEIKTAIYIHESQISVKDLGLKIAHETNEEKNYLKTVELTCKRGAVFCRLNCEKIVCDPDSFKLPENAIYSDSYGTLEKPCYDRFDESKSIFKNRFPEPKKGIIKRWIAYETIENVSFITTEAYYKKIEYSADRIRKMKLAEIINASQCFDKEISHYDITRLEEVVNISLKISDEESNKLQARAIINKRGGYREKSILNNNPVFAKTDTWNNDHKIIRVSAENGSCEVDLVTKKITN